MAPERAPSWPRHRRIGERAPQCLLGDFLDVGVDGYADVVSLDGLDRIDGVHDLAGRVDLDAFDAAIALQVRFEGLLHAILADDIARLVGNAVCLPLELFLRNRARIAEHMRRQVVIGVGAHGAGFRSARRETRWDAPRCMRLRGHRHRGRNAVSLRPLRLRGGKRRDGLVRNAQDIGEAFQHQLVVLDVGTREHGESRTVSHELHAVAIEDTSAWCDGRVLVDAVALCLGRVLGTGDDLHRPQLDDERADARADDGDEAEEATTRRALGIAAGPAMGLGAHGEFGSAARVDWDARGPAAARSHDDDDDGDGHDYEKNADCRKDCCRHALISLLESRLHA